MPDLNPKTLAEGASTSLYAALDPELRGKSSCHALRNNLNLNTLMQ